MRFSFSDKPRDVLRTTHGKVTVNAVVDAETRNSHLQEVVSKEKNKTQVFEKSHDVDNPSHSKQTNDDNLVIESLETEESVKNEESSPDAEVVLKLQVVNESKEQNAADSANDKLMLVVV